MINSHNFRLFTVDIATVEFCGPLNHNRKVQINLKCLKMLACDAPSMGDHLMMRKFYISSHSPALFVDSEVWQVFHLMQVKIFSHINQRAYGQTWCEVHFNQLWFCLHSEIMEDILYTMWSCRESLENFQSILLNWTDSTHFTCCESFLFCYALWRFKMRWKFSYALFDFSPRVHWVINHEPLWLTSWSPAAYFGQIKWINDIQIDMSGLGQFEWQTEVKRSWFYGN